MEYFYPIGLSLLTQNEGLVVLCHASVMEHLLLFVFASGLKLLLLPTYRSTDFEVHRNWLAITSSIPILDWYTEATSEWTLDYPPLFAWFEFVLAFGARWADAAMLQVTNLQYASHATVVFQRGSVIATDAVLYVALWRFYSFHFPQRGHKFWILMSLTFLQPGLLLVDHIHFQYNGFLFGVLVYCFCFFQEGKTLAAGVTFAALLCLKHIFIYMLPAAFVWLLRFHCHVDGAFSFAKFFGLGFSVLAVFFAALGPWLLTGRIADVVGRLFPFGRGLCHAYWAPNFWALYNIADKAVCAGLQKALGPRVVCGALSSKGLVGTSGTIVSTSHAVLFHVSPPLSLSLVGLAMLGLARHIWGLRTPCAHDLILSFAASAYSFFMFGWHVHEKATLMYVLPLSLLNMHPAIAGSCWHLTLLSTYALFPLLFEPRECLFKWAVAGAYLAAAHLLLPGVAERPAPPPTAWQRAAHTVEWGLAWGVPGLALLLGGVLPFTRLGALEFLPLMLVSVYTAVGMGYYWVKVHCLLGCGRYALLLTAALGLALLLRTAHYVATLPAVPGLLTSPTPVEL